MSGRSTPKTRSPRSAACPAASARSRSRSHPRTRIASVQLTSSRRDGSAGVACPATRSGRVGRTARIPSRVNGIRAPTVRAKTTRLGAAARWAVNPGVWLSNQACSPRCCGGSSRTSDAGSVSATELRSAGAGLHMTAGCAQLRDDEVLSPEQADVDGISGVRWRVGVALLAVTRRRHGNLPDGTAEPDEASKEPFGRLAFSRTSAPVSSRPLDPARHPARHPDRHPARHPPDQPDRPARPTSPTPDAQQLRT